VTWRSNNHSRTWNLTVRTASTTFTNCSTVPQCTISLTYTATAN
jgi:hypothetical protein